MNVLYFYQFINSEQNLIIYTKNVDLVFTDTGIISAVTWPASLVTLASVIDNPWGVCCRRSAAVGRQLAILLQQRQHGRRPVTLIGFSLGARVIYYCIKVSILY